MSNYITIADKDMGLLFLFILLFMSFELVVNTAIEYKKQNTPKKIKKV